jgi:hypothetical protein
VGSPVNDRAEEKVAPAGEAGAQVKEGNAQAARDSEGDQYAASRVSWIVLTLAWSVKVLHGGMRDGAGLA